MTTAQVIPLNGSGFGGTLNVETNTPNGVEWQVNYGGFEILDDVVYQNINRAKTGNPLQIKSIMLNTTVEQLNNTFISFVRRLITGIYVQRQLKVNVTSKMIAGVHKIDFAEQFELNYETSLQLNIAPNTQVIMYIDYQNKNEGLRNEKNENNIKPKQNETISHNVQNRANKRSSLCAKFLHWLQSW